MDSLTFEEPAKEVFGENSFKECWRPACMESRPWVCVVILAQNPDGHSTHLTLVSTFVGREALPTFPAHLRALLFDVLHLKCLNKYLQLAVVVQQC